GDKFKIYIDGLVERNLFVRRPHRFSSGAQHLDDDSFDGLGFTGRDAPEFREIHSYLDAATKRSSENWLRNESASIFSRITFDEAAYSKLYEYGSDKDNF
ncbi:MAG: hypothetical protein J0653_05710, partial [Deltaproteobacteria bacterium]|nr:hypothetical protein [Deltaproteobacteria bacterium]